MEQVLELRVIRRAKEGEAGAFTELIDEHQHRLLCFLHRICADHALCEDIVQDAFVRVLRNIDRFDERHRFSTWLFTIAKRLLFNALQKHRPLCECEWLESWESPGRGLTQMAEMKEVQENLSVLLDEAMESLSPIQRETVVLYHHHGQAVSDIASLLDIPCGTVKSHLHRARGRMRDWIRGDARMDSCVVEMLDGAA